MIYIYTHYNTNNMMKKIIQKTKVVFLTFKVVAQNSPDVLQETEHPQAAPGSDCESIGRWTQPWSVQKKP